MSLRPVILIFGIVGLLAAGYLFVTASGGDVALHGFSQRSFDGPLFALATAFVSVLLLATSRRPATE